MKGDFHAWVCNQGLPPHETLAIQAIDDFQPTADEATPLRLDLPSFFRRYRATKGWGSPLITPASWTASPGFLGILRGVFGATLLPQPANAGEIHEVQLPNGLLLQLQFDPATWASGATQAARSASSTFARSLIAPKA